MSAGLGAPPRLWRASLLSISTLVVGIALTGVEPLPPEPISDSAGPMAMMTGPALPPPPPPAPPQPAVAGPATLVTPLTGPSSPDRTHRRWHVYGADLGHLIEDGDGLYIVFGDTFGPKLLDWRSNSLARMSRVGPGGMRLDGFPTTPNGHAKEILPSKKVVEEEVTVIPTGGRGQTHLPPQPLRPILRSSPRAMEAELCRPGLLRRRG